MDHDDDYYDEEPPLALAGALDADGKALFGTPGPGTYGCPTSFRPKGLHPGEDDAGRHLYKRAAAFSLASGHKDIVPTTDVPGPDAYGVPKDDITVKAAARATFGASTRQVEGHRFLSEALSTQAPKDTPGPGLYKQREGKGFSKSIGDAPTWKFGTSPQRPDEFAPAKLAGASKSHFYDIPEALGARDGTSNAVFAPMGRRDRGVMRSRDEGANIYISRKHCETQRDPQQEFAPAPGWYHLEDIEQLSTFSKNTRVTFGKGPRSTQAKANYLYVSKAFCEFGQESPGPGYPAKPVGKLCGPKFGSGNKTYDPELGGNKGGPFISRLHTRTVCGADSPGPCLYNPELDKELGPKMRIGRGLRPDITAGTDTKAPGPGAYQPKKDRGYYSYKQNGSYSIASNLRTDFTRMAGNIDGPGPGNYDTDVGIAAPHPGKKRAPGWKMGVKAPAADDDAVPGPGNYKANTVDDIGKKTGYTFGAKEKVPARSRNGQPPRYRGAGSDAECLGIDSPGPKYGVREAPRYAPGAGAKNFKFGTSARVNEKVFISKVHADNGIRLDAPGPGAYEPKTDNTSKYKSRGGCSFGTAPRPSLATVKF